MVLKSRGGSRPLRQRALTTPCVNAVTQPMPWDPMIDYRFMKKNTEDFMSL